MTVQDFIVNYNETFRYLDARFGKAAVVRLWAELGAANTKLRDMVRQRGLPGYYSYFYGEQGTCSREDLVGGATIEDGVYTERVVCCPSVSELEERGKPPYRHYCEHCYWLYNRSLEENGFCFDTDYQLQPSDGGYVKACVARARKREVDA